MHTFLRKLAFAFGLTGTMCALAIVAGQLLSWLELDTWPQVTVLHALIAFGLRPPTSTWPTFQRIIATAMGIPLSIVVFGLGLWLRQTFRSLAADYQPKGRQT